LARSTIRSLVEPGGFCDEGDNGVQAAPYALQAHSNCVRINAIQIGDHEDATPVMLNYYQTTCGWYANLPEDGTGMADALLPMFYESGACSCP
jgi:hypothetical protein